MFADDVQIYIECDIVEIEHGIQKINEDLRSVARFCSEYGIDFNCSKTKAIIVS